MNGRTNSTSTGAEFIEIPLDPVTNLNAEAGNGSVRLTWTDPKNKYATDEGETAQDPDQLVSVWKYTKIVRKIGEYSQNPNDGVVVVESGVHNQYQTNPYIDEGLTNDTTYFYSVYAINEDNVESDPVQITVTPVAGVALSSLPEGTIVKINENGSPVEFYITQHNYQSDLNGNGRTLLVRKDATALMRISSNGLNDYLNQLVDKYLNNEYKSRFSSVVTNLISTTRVKFMDPANSNNIINQSRSSFLLSANEYGIADDISYGSSSSLQSYQLEGDTVAIASTLRTVRFNGSLKIQWTRSPVTGSARGSTAAILTNGTGTGMADDSTSYQNENAVRPAFTLPETSTVDTDMLFMENQ